MAYMDLGQRIAANRAVWETRARRQVQELYVDRFGVPPQHRQTMAQATRRADQGAARLDPAVAEALRRGRATQAANRAQTSARRAQEAAQNVLQHNARLDALEARFQASTAAARPAPSHSQPSQRSQHAPSAPSSAPSAPSSAPSALKPKARVSYAEPLTARTESESRGRSTSDDSPPAASQPRAHEPAPAQSPRTDEAAEPAGPEPGAD
jgi:hypothetical protein